MTSSFKIGDLVFAKMKGYPHWPAVVVSPPEELLKDPSAYKKGMHCILFFGTKNFRWLEHSALKQYSENKVYFSNSSKAANFKKACEEIEYFAETGLPVTPLNLVQYTNDRVFLNAKKSKSVRKRSISPDAMQKDYKRKFFSCENTNPFLQNKAEQQSIFEKVTMTKDSIGKWKCESLSPNEVKIHESVFESQTSTPLQNLDNQDAELQKSMDSDGGEKEDTYDKTTDNAQPSSSQGRTQVESVVSYKGDISATDSDSDSSSGSLEYPIMSDKNIISTSQNFGFIGLGNIGSGIVKNLLNSNHKVTVWNRTTEKCEEFINAGAKGAMTPGDVIEDADITFCCVSSESAAKQIVFGNCGVLSEMKTGKAYVEMSGISDTASTEISNAITECGGRYLEVRFQGCRPHADRGILTILASGDRTLFDDCSSCFAAISIKTHFLGGLGKAPCIAPFLNSYHAVMLSACCEILELASRFNFSKEDMLKFCEEMNLLSPFILQKCRAALSGYFDPEMAIKDLKNSTDLALQYANRNTLNSSMIAFAHERIKYNMRLGLGDLDIARLCVPKSHK